jgi:tetratricopeptide (TPR) repeat protein
MMANSPEELFSQANKAYQAEKYLEALEAYQKIESLGVESPELYYNLGNCFYQNQNVGYAILYYEKALKLNPNFDDAIQNLKITQKSTVDKIEAIPEIGIVRFLKGISNVQSLRNWSIQLIVFGFVFLLSVIFFQISQDSKTRKRLFGLGTLSLLSSVIFLIFTLLSNHYNKEEWVLVEPNSYIKTAPQSTGKDLFILHEGIKIQKVDENTDYIQIKLKDGVTGWAEKKKYRKI